MVLLERDRELGEIAGALDLLGRGQGGLVLVEGAAGIGKTALLDEACALAAGTGTGATAAAARVRVLRAGAGELEQDFPYGVVRQLFEPPLRAADPGERRALLAGSAEPAAATPATPPPAPLPAAEVGDDALRRRSRGRRTVEPWQAARARPTTSAAR